MESVKRHPVRTVNEYRLAVHIEAETSGRIGQVNIRPLKAYLPQPDTFPAACQHKAGRIHDLELGIV